VLVGVGAKDCYVGDEAQTRKGGLLERKYPIQRGTVANWDNMEKIWHHIFYNELRVAPEDHPALLTESVFYTAAEREKVTQILFETFDCPLFESAPAPLLGGKACACGGSLRRSVFAGGAIDGIGMEFGETFQVLPVYQGHALRLGAKGLKKGGADLTHSLVVKMSERGYSFTTTAEMEILRDVKEKLCTLKETEVVTLKYELPDGQFIALDKEAHLVPEEIFSEWGIHIILHQCIADSPREIRYFSQLN
jgi:actin-related protein